MYIAGFRNRLTYVGSRKKPAMSHHQLLSSYQLNSRHGKIKSIIVNMYTYSRNAVNYV